MTRATSSGVTTWDATSYYQTRGVRAVCRGDSQARPVFVRRASPQWSVRNMEAGTPIRLLVMEDDLGQARLVQRALQRAGYLVDLAHDGAAGLALHKAQSYDLLIVDHQMPGTGVWRSTHARRQGGATADDYAHRARGRSRCCRGHETRRRRLYCQRRGGPVFHLAAHRDRTGPVAAPCADGEAAGGGRVTADLG